MPAATRNQLLARLHCLKRDMGWDDDTYRDILFARTGHRSAGELDGPALARAVAALGAQRPEKGSGSISQAKLEPDPFSEWDWANRATPARQPLIWKLRRLLIGAGIEEGKQVAYAEGIARQMSGANASAGPVVKPLALCDEHELWRIVAAVAKQVQRQGGDPNHV